MNKAGTGLKEGETWIEHGGGTDGTQVQIALYT